MTNILFVLFGPTFSGKSTLSDKLLVVDGRVRRIRSCTTRDRRIEKNEPIDAYHWLTRAEFDAQIKEGRFVEYDLIPSKKEGVLVENLYGRRWADFADLAKGPCIADMTESGLAALQAHEDFRVVSIKIEPRNRKSDRRIEERAEADARRALIPVRTDHVIVNDHGDLHGLNHAFAALRKIIDSHISPGS